MLNLEMLKKVQTKGMKSIWTYENERNDKHKKLNIDEQVEKTEGVESDVGYFEGNMVFNCKPVVVYESFPHNWAHCY